MSGYDLFKDMSDLDADLVVVPRKHISPIMNLLFCIIAANISALVPHERMVLSIIVFVVSFGVLYGAAYWILNRKRKDRLLVDDGDMLDNPGE